MNEKRLIISLTFVSLSFSAFLFGYYLVNGGEVLTQTKAQLLPGFTPTTQATLKTNLSKTVTPIPTKTPETRKVYVVKKGDLNLIMIQEPSSSVPQKILETRLPNPILEWQDDNTLYLKSIKNNEAITFLLTLDGQLTQVK